MKVIAIGDIHGRKDWKFIINNSEFDHVVFIGDYLDGYPRENFSVEEQIDNFKEILLYKKTNPEKCTLLVGNHDYHYIPAVLRSGIKYSRFNSEFAEVCGNLIMQAFSDGYLQACKIIDGVLYTHAGVTNTWCQHSGVPSSLLDDADADEELEQFINNLLLYNTGMFNFSMPSDALETVSQYGDDIWQSPMWVRPTSLLQDKVEGFDQVVGHTQMPDGVKVIEHLGKVAFIDALGIDASWLEVDDGNFNVKHPF